MMMQGDYVRRASAEFVGAFTLTFAAVGALSFAGQLLDVAMAYGLAMAVMASAVGHICGAHFNPAITFGFWITRRMSTLLALVYWIAQFAGAILAALLLKWILPAAAISGRSLGVPQLNSEIGAGEGLVLEAVLTFFLAWVIFASAVDPDGSFNKIAGLAIGFTVSLGVLVGFALTGGILNPSRALGPMLVQNKWDDFWIWIVGPGAGAAIAALLYELLYLRPVETKATT